MNKQPDNNQEEFNTMKGEKGFKRIINAAGYSFAGLSAAFKNEAAFRQLVLLNCILFVFAFFLDVSKVERLLLVASVFITLIIELLNSAIEATVDRISLSIHPLSKRAKDMGSAAQLLGLALVAMTWITILF